MKLGDGHYRKISLRDEKSRRWARMRAQEARGKPTTPPGSGVEAVSEYFDDDEKQRVRLKKAGIGALIVHFLAFLLVIPDTGPEVFPLETAAATVVKRYTPPAPPAKAKKTRKKKANPIPIPDPTPDEPEPIEPTESEIDFGEFDEDFSIGAPVGIPGVSSGARDGAYRAGEGGIMSPQVIRQVDPEYTPDATRRGIQGEVWIEAVVDNTGRVIEPRLLRGLPDEELNRRAMDAIQRWIFRPGMKDGEPVAVIAVFTVTYRLH